MLQAVDRYSTIHTVTRAMYADMLSKSVWQALIQTTNYNSLLELLTKSLYAPHLEIARELLTPRRVVYQIRQRLVDVYAKLIRLAPQTAKNLLLTLWHHYEVDNIKAALRGREAGANWNQVLHLLYPMGSQTAVTVDMLKQIVEADDIETAIGVLTGGSYHTILVHALTRYREENSLFPLEVALDLGYRRLLWDAIFELKGLDRHMALRTIGTVLDNDNLLWAIRYRIYHHLSEEEIINYTLSVGYDVSDADIRAIARGEDLSSIVFRIYPEIQEQLTGNVLDTGGGLQRLERALFKLALNRCRKTFIGYPFHIGIPLSYVWLAENEIQDLTILIEAKASGTQQDIYKPMLVMGYGA